jgi:hypothetical protein
VLAQVTATKDQLVEAHNKLFPQDKAEKPAWRVRGEITKWVGNPQTVDDAVATLKTKIAAALTPQQGIKKATRINNAERMIQLHDELLGVPEADRQPVNVWEERLQAESAAAAQAAALAAAPVGQAGRIPGAVTTIDPATLATQTPPAAVTPPSTTPSTAATAVTPPTTAPKIGPAGTEVPAKPTSPAELEAYKAAITPHLLAGVKPEELEALQMVHGVNQQNAGDTEAAAATLREMAKGAGIPHNTLADRANRGLAKIEANAAQVDLPVEAAQALLGMQTSLDVHDIALPSDTYEGTQRVNVAPSDDFAETETQAYEPKLGQEQAEVAAPVVAGEEAPVARAGEEVGGEAAAAGEGADAAVEAAHRAEFENKWVDHQGQAISHADVQDATQEWEEGRAADEPTWDRLTPTLQLQWVRGYIAAHDLYPKAKQEPERARHTGRVREAIQEQANEADTRAAGADAGLNRQAEEGADVAGGTGGGERQVGRVQAGVQAEGAGRVPPAAPEGQKAAEPQKAGQGAGAAPAAAKPAEPVTTRKKRVVPAKQTQEAAKKPAPGTKTLETHKVETTRERAQRKWSEASAVVPELGAWGDLSQESQDDFRKAEEKDQNVADAMKVKEADGKPGVQRSEASIKGEGGARKTATTATHIRDTLKKLFFSDSRLDQKVTIVQSVADLDPKLVEQMQLGPNDQGFTTKDGHVTLIADNIDKGSELGIFLHEMGVHVGMEGLIGKANMVSLAKQVANWSELNDGSPHAAIAERAIARVDNAAKSAEERGQPFTPANYMQESIAYFVEEAVHSGVNPTALDSTSELGRWFRRLWAAAKVALRKVGLGRFDSLTAQDVVNLAYGAARIELEGNWHGTAADFRKFSHAYMGTGEGAQAFGWGTYLAQRPGIAKDYWASDVERKGRTAQAKPAGSLMRVDVGVADHEWLDLDKPFSEQSQHVQDALNKLVPETKPTAREVVAAYEGWIHLHPDLKQGDRIAAVLRQWEEGEGRGKIQDLMREQLDETDFEAYSKMRKAVIKQLFTPIRSEMRGENIYPMLVDQFGSKQAASEALDKAGIKGNRFYDQPSRGQNNPVHEGPVRSVAPRLVGTALPFFPSMVIAPNAMMSYDPRTSEIRVQTQQGWKVFSQSGFHQHPDHVALAQALRKNFPISNMEKGLTRNFVVFNDKNIHRAVTQVGAKRGTLQFSQRAPVAEAAKTQATKQLTNVQTFAQKHGLGVMITEDIADLAAHHGLPEVRQYVDAAKEREAARVEFEQPVGKVAEMYDKLPERERGTGEGSVNKFIHDATIRGDTKGIERLSASGQAMVKAVFKHGSDTLALKKKLIDEDVGREYDRRIAEETTPEAKAELRAERATLLSKFSKLMTVENSDTYAPLKRFGDFVVSAKSKEYVDAEERDDKEWINKNQSNPAHVQVQFADTQGEADALEKEVKQDANFKGGKTYAAAREADIHNHRDLFRAFPVLQSKLAAAFPTEGVSPMQRIIRDLYLQALAENSARKGEMQRRKIAGASTDMTRAFVTQGRADASFLSNLKHNDALQNAVQAMRKGADRDRRTLTPYLNEMLKRHAASYEQHNHRLTDALKRAGSMWLLATNPSFYLQQIVQPASMSLPVIAGEHGYFRSARALKQGYSDVLPLTRGTGLTEHMDWSKAPADVRDMLHTISRNGAIDITNAMDQGEWEIADKGRMGAAWNRIDAKLRGLNTRVEAINRSVTAIAAYRLALARNGGDKAAATDYAERMVRQTHGSYDASNTPRYMQHPVMQVLTQFRRFQIIQLSLIARLGYNAFKGSTAMERGIARRALTYTLLHSAAIGGALGMPGAIVLTNLIARLFGPSDEPPDFEKEARELIGDQLISDLLLKGVPAMLGVDLSSKLGMGQMLSIAPFADFPTDRKSGEKYITAALGPVTGLTLKALDGLDQIYQGHVAKGSEQLMPSGIANAMKAYRVATEGVTMRSGDTILSKDDINFADTLMQGLGMPTTTITHQQRLGQVKYEFDTYYKDQTTQLVREYQQARKDGAPVADIMSDWRDLQDARVRNGYTRQPVSMLIKAAQQQKKYERATAGGVEFTKANKRFVQEQANL